MRKEFSRKVREQAFSRCGGRCESCTRKLMVGDYHYDHINPDAMTGEPTLDNCQVLCKSCHRIKTDGDIKIIAKSKRIQRKAAGIKRSRRLTAWRRFNGDIVRAPRERY